MAPDQYIPSIQLPGSKSISNRLLMIRAIGNLTFEIENISDSDDTSLLIKALKDVKENKEEINIGHAGTNMRFLCSYLACLGNKAFILTGSDRIKQRPIKDLVDSLQMLGADISYLEKEGFPPIKIKGKQLNGSEITINAHVSSQYISSLLLITPLFKNGCIIKLNGEVVSSSYIKMTITLMQTFGINITWIGNFIEVKAGCYKEREAYFYNESDWSAASYFYSAFLFGNLNKIELQGLLANSIQADSTLVKIFSEFGVTTEFDDKKIILSKTKKNIFNYTFNFLECPDIAQTIATTCLGLRITAQLTGLQTLKIKETDRITALKNELEKFGAIVEVTDNSLNITGYRTVDLKTIIEIITYNDHRMAMCFAPLQFMYPNIYFENKHVVSKSFPHFWDELSKLNP